MRMVRIYTLLLFTAISVFGQSSTAWKLVWSDEFNGAANTPPDPTKWNYDLGAGGWGNGEQETYTNSLANAYQDGKGNLVIKAIKDAQGNYTSARIRSGQENASDKVNLNWQYGKIEARIKLPFGPGVWPAFWMLGGNIQTVDWPQCGEIDIMENFGANVDTASTAHGTLHGPPAESSFAGDGLSGAYTLPFQQTFTNDYHLFSVQWSQNQIQFFVDGTQYQTLTPANLPAGSTWVFNQPFFILLNLAIGGPTTFLGQPTAQTPFPQQMLVDYVRVYQQTAVAPATPAIAPGGVLNAASNLTAITPGALASVYGSNLADTLTLTYSRTANS